MPDGLVDIGGGFKVINPDTFKAEVKSGVQVASEYLGLMNLQNQIENAPLEKRKLAAEASLRENDVNMIGWSNAELIEKVKSSINKEKRDQTEFFINNSEKAVQLFNVNPKFGEMALKQVFQDNVSITEQKDGTFDALVGQGENSFVLHLDPNKVASPTTIKGWENDLSQQYKKDLASFDDQSSYYKRILNLSTSTPIAGKPGLRDATLLVNYVKFLIPNARVSEDNLGTFEGAEGIPSQVGSLIQQFLTGKKLDQDQIDNLVNLAKIQYKDSYESAKLKASAYYKKALTQQSNPSNVISPIGPLRVEDFMPLDQLTPEQRQESYKRQKEFE